MGRRRKLLALTILAAGALVMGLGVGAALGYEQWESTRALPASGGAADEVGGLSADLRLHLGIAGVAHVDRVETVDPAASRALPLPGFSVKRALGFEAAPLDAGVDLDLKMGSHAARGGDEGEVLTQSSRQAVLAPAAPAAALAAAAFAGAGLLVYFWASIKTWAYKLLVVPLVPLYAHVTRSEVFDNEVRERIFRAIAAEPGVSASELSRSNGVSWGTTIYHLDVLEQTRMVTSIRDGRYRRYFQNGAGLDATKEVVSILRNPVTSRVAETVRAAPGATQKELAQSLGLSPQALHWHLVRLVGADLVEKRREGRLVRHFAKA